MSFKVQPIRGDRYEVVFSGEPPYIRALPMAPGSREPELDHGVWLVVTFPVWSAPIRHSIVAAMECAKEHGGAFQLGVQPYDSKEEIWKWWPASEPPLGGEVLVTERDEPFVREVRIRTDPETGPVWLVLRDGHTIHQAAGPLSKEQLSEIMATALDFGADTQGR